MHDFFSLFLVTSHTSWFTFKKIQKYITSVVIQGKHLNISIRYLHCDFFSYFTQVTRIITRHKIQVNIIRSKKTKIFEDLMHNASLRKQKHTGKSFYQGFVCFFQFEWVLPTALYPVQMHFCLSRKHFEILVHKT